MVTAGLFAIRHTTANGDPAVETHPTISQVTWTADVAPIVERRCVSCHTLGGFAPMSLTTYNEARPWASAIRQEVLARRMPPWFAARGFGDFANDRSLSRFETEVLAAWAEGNAPLGPTPAKRSTESARTTNPPADLVLTVPIVQVQKPIERFHLTTSLHQTRWIGGWGFTPGMPSLVRQARLMIAPDTIVGTWIPGESETTYPTGVARRLPAASRLILEVHYRKPTGLTFVRSAVSLYFTQNPTRELESRFYGCGTTTIEDDIDALAVQPVTTEPGSAIEVVARRTDGTMTPLAVIPEYDPSFPLTYRFRSAIRLGGGTHLDVRSIDESCGAYLDIVAARSPSRTATVNGAVRTSPSR